MQLEQLELTGGGTLTLYLRESVEAMPHFRQRPLVLVVPGGGYTHVSPREGDPVALQFAAVGLPHGGAALRSRGERPGCAAHAAAGTGHRPCAAARRTVEYFAGSDRFVRLFCRRASGAVRCGVGYPRHGRPAAAQRPAAGLPGGHRRRIRPQGQLCAADRHAGCCRPPALYAGG